jgi:hypothetical protein
MTWLARQQKGSIDPVDIDSPHPIQHSSPFNGLIPFPHRMDMSTVFNPCRFSGS